MPVVALVPTVAGVVVRLSDQVPKDDDVKAGWTAFVLFLLLIAAVVFLGFSLTKQLRKAQAAEDAGVYGADTADEGADDAADNGANDGAEDGAEDGADDRADVHGDAKPENSEPENHSAS